MQTESAVQFPTPTRVHIALAVADVERATAFYSALLSQPATKRRPGYAKFEVFDPPVNLALNETPDAAPPPMPQHFGIQVKARAAVTEIAERMKAAGFSGVAEDAVTCCYAVQDKVWVTDPDGHRWEVFLVTQGNTEEHSVGRVGPSATEGDDPCCEPTCCVPESDAAEAPNADAKSDAKADAESEAPCCPPSCCQ